MTLRLFIAVWFAVTLPALSPEGVPKDAKETSPGVYRQVDKDGKAWVYRRTPFGYQKSAEAGATEPDAKAKSGESRVTPFGKTTQSAPVKEDAPAPAAGTTVKTPFGDTKTPQSTVQTKVIEDGDVLRFERPSPFGMSRWTRKKSELTEDEKKLWESQRTSPGQTNPQ